MPSKSPILTATPRAELGKKTAHIRRAGQLPAVVFGHGLESMPVSIDAHEFALLRRTLRSNSMIDLRVDGQSRRVMLHGVQVDPRTQRLLHVDLFAPRQGEEVTVDVPVHTTGESHAVEKLGGTLLHNVDHVRVRALPDNLPEAIRVSIEPLVDFDAAIHLRDVAMPSGVTLLSDLDEVVAKVMPPVVAETPAEAAAPEEAPAGEVPATGEGPTTA